MPGRAPAREIHALKRMSLIKNLLRRGGSSLDELELAGDTHVGLMRAQNEDSYIYVNERDADAVLVAVADGMGGHEFGEVASYLCARYLLWAWNERSSPEFHAHGDVTDFIDAALSRANRHIFHVNKVLRIRWAMGTTATVGVLWRDKIVVGHVGDSRCYRLRRQKLKLLTADQNWQAEMVRHGILSEGEAAGHPLCNMLTNCIGALQNLRIEFHTFDVYPGDRYLLCTDGVSSMIDEHQIQQALAKAETAADSVKSLVHSSLRNGGSDNITAVTLFA